ncbi:MAG: 30S ribosomal protein S3 [Leptolyngbya sp. PLA2]|nr:30S ribosomal protein S3 [Leptolyngbya sp.]MCE7970654.1 30S ribosomal protein S3 [Leptolyngbya sp. PL-A2]MCQ3939808.1 30S ribosomal protein S3 [cyanobacterium CYA1]MCZ7633375.1 30S ribosomal protein S3 [Phycisphaerales bacterium]MDL1903447.1 30S ribosomal protein S3 [Synechococcales cyanobacterium CNB]
MGQKTHPFGLRLGITEAHRSRWYAPKALYGELLVEDEKIRQHLDKRLNRTPPNAAVSDIHIERTREELKVIIRTARPGLVIGPKGAEVERITQELAYMTGRKVAISIIEIKQPDLDAQLVAEGVAEQLAKRAAFRRVVKTRAEGVMQAGAKGVKILISGRLGGAEMSRQLDVRLGSLPLSTLQAHVDYGFAEARTGYGVIGVKVWIYRGMYDEQQTEEESASRAAGARPRARGRH